MMNQHLETGLAESRAANVMSDWEHWCADVERRLGIDNLDGDQIIDGYSIDGAFDAFSRGARPATYAAAVKIADKASGAKLTQPDAQNRLRALLLQRLTDLAVSFESVMDRSDILDAIHDLPTSMENKNDRH